MTKSGALIGIQLVTGKLTASHATDCMDEVPTVEIFKAILIRIMGIGAAVELVS